MIIFLLIFGTGLLLGALGGGTFAALLVTGIRDIED